MRSKDQDGAPLPRLTDMIIRRPFWGRFIGTGTLAFSTASGVKGPVGQMQGMWGYEVVWNAVPDPVDLKAQVEAAMAVRNLPG